MARRCCLPFVSLPFVLPFVLTTVPLWCAACAPPSGRATPPLWRTYEDALRKIAGQARSS